MRLKWTHKDIPIKGFPFDVYQSIIMQCQYGIAHKKKKDTKEKVYSCKVCS